MKHALMRADAGAHLVDETEPRRQPDDRGSGDEQAGDGTLALGGEKENAEDRGQSRKDEGRQQARARGFHQTRSLVFSAIRPVGRTVMMAMITAKANTSL